MFDKIFKKILVKRFQKNKEQNTTSTETRPISKNLETNLKAIQDIFAGTSESYCQGIQVGTSTGINIEDE